MTICGVKITHDSAVALIDNHKLIFCVETEKINNNKRHSELIDINQISLLLKKYEYDIENIDIFCIDGWRKNDINSALIKHELQVAEYTFDCEEKIFLKKEFNGLELCGKRRNYISFFHTTNHIMSSYCTSPFSERKLGSYILIWDGEIFPQLYYFDGENIKFINTLFNFTGYIYNTFAVNFSPYKDIGLKGRFDLSLSGKVMAYVAYGKFDLELYEAMEKAEMEMSLHRPDLSFVSNFVSAIKSKTFKDEDALYTFHKFIENKLIGQLKLEVEKFGHEKNICLGGGCSLNIKWNSAIRNSGIFNNVFIPPFPNDSGNAIGAACMADYLYTGNLKLDWNVYSGPVIDNNASHKDWDAVTYSIEELANLIHQTNEPVLFLNSNAELGPRALGNRSILASATNSGMKKILNCIKKREDYRPIAPICLEEYADKIFSPGTPDPYMLFDHTVNESWLTKVPAICHLDNTARLQTVNENQNPIIYRLLISYYEKSGIPLLCNTSANELGKGFFSSVYDAMNWGEIDYIWSNNLLYFKKQQ